VRGRAVTTDDTMVAALIAYQRRAIELHDLALSLVCATGRPALGDCSSMTECKVGQLTIRYRAKERWLDVICDGRVLTVEVLQVIRYIPGGWETTLTRAARVTV
jgi:hypothetical protein